MNKTFATAKDKYFKVTLITEGNFSICATPALYKHLDCILGKDLVQCSLVSQFIAVLILNRRSSRTSAQNEE